MRAVACIGVVALCLGLASCKGLNHRSPGGGAVAPEPPADRAPAAGPGERTAPQPGVGGILAGQIIDTYNRPPQRTYIQVVASSDLQKDGRTGRIEGPRGGNPGRCGRSCTRGVSFPPGAVVRAPLRAAECARELGHTPVTY